MGHLSARERHMRGQRCGRIPPEGKNTPAEARLNAREWVFMDMCVWIYVCREAGIGVWIDACRCVWVYIGIFMCANMCANIEINGCK